MEKSIPSNSKIKYFLLSILFMILFIFTALKFSSPLTAYADTTTTWYHMSPTVRTDAGVLERRQAQRRWSGREQDGVASEHNGALPQRGRFGSSITPNLCVPCYPLQPHCLQAFPTSYSIFHLVFVLKSMNTFCFPIFSTFSWKNKYME